MEYRSKCKKQKNIDKSLVEMISEKNCDIIILAEYSFQINPLLNKININNINTFSLIPNNNGCKKIKGFIKNKYKSNIEILHESTRYKIIKIKTTSYKLLIGMIHNADKRNSSEDKQVNILQKFNNDICYEEKTHMTKNTIVLGDFNASPFEKPLVAAHAMHAIPFKEEVLIRSRVINGVSYEKFYNPMWKLFASQHSPYATYHYNNSDFTNYYWYLFDQIIIRPQLISALDELSLSIIVETQNHNLLKNNKPNKEDYSDHLPIFCKIKEEKIK